MLPGLGAMDKVTVEVISKPKNEFNSPSYASRGLPKPPAIMIDDEVVVAGRDISEAELEKAISRHLEERRGGGE